MENILESNDITLSRTELYSIVAQNVGVTEEEVSTVMESFIDLFLKRLKLK